MRVVEQRQIVVLVRQFGRPTDNYQARVAAAAGGKNLPDLFAADVIDAPNYVSQGLWLDITDKINALPYAKDIVQAPIKAGSKDGKECVVPHTLDLSVLFWNKALFKKAGLDPDTPPKTMQEFAQDAETVRKKIGGITGSLLAFDQFFILTRGGPDGSTVSVEEVIYREAFTKFNLGGGAAISVLLLVVLVLLNILQLLVLKRGE